jgi:hypothetical protein
MTMKLGLSLAMALLLATGGGPSTAQPTADEVKAASEMSDNAFARANPCYKERTGAFYEKEYLEKALDQMATVVELTDDQKMVARRILRTFITDWLQNYVSGDGHISRENLAHCLALMDERFQGELSQAGYKAYLAWRKDETGVRNALAFMMNPQFAIPQTPAQMPEPNDTRENRKIQLSPLGFHTVDFSKEFWASLKDDYKLKGNVADVLSYEQIRRMVIIRCNIHVPAGDYLDRLIHGWITDATTFHSGPIPDNTMRDLRRPLLTVLFEAEKGELGLLTIYSDVAVIELNSGYGLLLKKSGGEQPAGGDAKDHAPQP